MISPSQTPSWCDSPPYGLSRELGFAKIHSSAMSSSTRPSSSARVAFPITAWTKVLHVQRGDPQAREALEQICKTYWPAIYTYLCALGCGREEAMDETQEFLTHFINGGGLQSISPERGRLRSYLRQSLRNHLATVRRDAARQKRGGGKTMISMDDADAFDVPSEPEAADKWFDRRWAWSVIRTTIERMEARYTARGRKALFDELKAGLISPDMLKPYAEIAKILGMTERQVKLEVHRARRRLADELRAEVAATLGPGTDVEEELRYLLSVLSCE